MADPFCLGLGIPERLHQTSRPELFAGNPEDRLFRRYMLITEATMTACLKFGDMSVNKEKLSPSVSSLPEDVLIDHQTGHIYAGCGVVTFGAGSLRAPEGDGRWRLEGVPGVFELRPVHRPVRCNYAHFEIEVFKDGKKELKIKLPTVKLAIRRHLRSKITILLPGKQEGENLPLD